MNDLTKYLAVRDQMRTGDGLGFANSGLVSEIIMKKTENDGPIPHSHWGGIIRLGRYEGQAKRRYTLEALSEGFYPDILSTYIQTYDGHIWWYQLRPEWDEKRDAIGEMALALVGTDYPFITLFKLALVKVSATARKGVCSQTWQNIYRELDPELKRKFRYILTPTAMHQLGIFKPPVQIL